MILNKTTAITLKTSFEHFQLKKFVVHNVKIA